MLTLLARLGLRAGEVAALSLDDIDWRAGEVTVRGKGSRSERLPLPADVGEAVAAYLRDGRPEPFEGARQVFLRARAPHRGLTTAGVSQAVFAAGAAGRARAGLRAPAAALRRDRDAAGRRAADRDRPGAAAPAGCYPRRSTPRPTSTRCARWPGPGRGGAA